MTEPEYVVSRRLAHGGAEIAEPENDGPNRTHGICLPRRCSGRCRVDQVHWVVLPQLSAECVRPNSRSARGAGSAHCDVGTTWTTERSTPDTPPCGTGSPPLACWRAYGHATGNRSWPGLPCAWSQRLLTCQRFKARSGAGYDVATAAVAMSVASKPPAAAVQRSKRRQACRVLCSLHKTLVDRLQWQPTGLMHSADADYRYSTRQLLQLPGNSQHQWPSRSVRQTVSTVSKRATVGKWCFPARSGAGIQCALH